MELPIQKEIPLNQYTTLHVGGVADYFVVVKTVEELRAAVRFAREQTARPPLVLGGGSNVLISDHGYRGLVIKNEISGIEVIEENDTIKVNVGSGMMFDDLVAYTVSNGWWGIENLSAIPGTVGATPIQNVGAYGVEMSSVIESVTAVHSETEETQIFTKADCRFAYRDSYFKSDEGRLWIVTHVLLTLTKNPNPKLHYKDLSDLSQNASLGEIRQAIIAIRSQKFPDWNTVGTAGSFFKNPIINKADYDALKNIYPDLPGFEESDGRVKVSLGWVLDKVCNLRGYSKNAIGLYEKQALVLINNGGTADDISQFQEMIVQTVKEKTDIDIEPEVTMLL